MANRTRSAFLPATRTVRYPDVAAASRPTEVIVLTPAQIAARQQEQRLTYLEWQLRQARIAEKDRRARRIMLGFGAVIGVGFLAALVVAGFVLAHVLSGIGLLVIPLMAVAGSAVAYGGHRCITVIQHWHQ